ncbi:MAG: TIGR02466 family protein [Pseudohongiellaceae bacterium]
MKPELMNLFAVPVYKSALGRGFTKSEMKFFKDELSDPVTAISNLSSRNKNVLDADPMKDIKTVLQKNVDTYFETIHNTANDVTLKITQSWLTMTRRGESHHAHIHPNSIASGVLYINLAENDGISFYRNEDMIWYELIPKEHNYYNAHSYFINTGVGDMVIFPSNIKHGVKEVSLDIQRVSLSFNTFFSGELGREAFSNSLNIKVNPQGGTHA